MAEKHKSKYKAPKDLEKSQKPKARKDLKDYTAEDKDEKMNPNSTGEKQQNVLRKTDKEVIDNGSQFLDIKDSERMYDVTGEKHDPKKAAKVMKKRQEDSKKTKEKIGNLTLEQKERLVREVIRRKIKLALREQEETDEPTEEPAPEAAPAPKAAPAPEAPEAEAPEAEAPEAESPAQAITAQLNNFVTLVKNQPTSPEQVKMILKAVQKVGTSTDDQGVEVTDPTKLKDIYRYLSIAVNRMLEKYS